MAKKPTTSSERVYFTSGDNALPLPNLIAHQKDSWRWFVEEGLSEIFSEVNPIDDYTGQKLSLKFGKYYFGEPKNTDQFAKENNLTFEAPLHATVELTNKTTGVVEEQEIYLGEYPWMTDRGTFVINGTERVVVSQLIRSAGVFFTAETVAGRNYYGAKIIPGRGAWMEFETTSNGTIYVKIDRRRKIPATTLLRALGYPKTSEIKELFADIDTGDVKYIDETLDKDTSRGANEALIEVYRRLRPGDLATVDNARQMIERMFFDFKRFDYSRVGRYKLNQRLGLDVANTAENRTLQMSDLVAILREVIRLNNTQEPADDIDALSNRRVRLVGELIARQFRVGMLRMQRNAMDRMSVADLESVSPSQLINARPIVAAVREFFTSSQLSQLLDEVNPLSELSHKRRLSSTGPGGLTRERAGFEVRDAHPTHYGRICSVETPEGANIGLVLNLAAYARVNEYGFIETPYLRVKDGKVTDELVYLDASQEIGEVIADAGEALNEDGTFRDERVNARSNMQPSQVDASQVTFMDAAHRQILGSTAALVPFIEKTRVDRALTGSNMQRQAVPLLCPESATVGTGIEKAVAENSGHLIQASADGEVVRADADEVHVKYADGVKIYTLKHFVKNNDDRCYNQKVRVERGDKVKKGDILIEGASIAGGEIALGKNLLVAFMPWGGYNMEDAIIMSRRLVEDDRLTSINIKDYTVEVRETKLGPEIVTRDIPNVSEESLRHLDENGIVQIGSEVKAGDVLVGKITPKGEQELSSEERLLRAIFGEKAKDVRDTSQRMNNAGGGKVVGVKIFSRENGHELKAGVLMQIQIFVAQLRKIGVGDKMAGRFGNKGVVAKVLPVEDMPFLEDGTPVDVVLNPLGVPSRMNLGQIFETHLGMAARALGYRVATPSFNGVPSEKISDELEKAGLARDGKSQLFDGRTGEPFEERTTVGVMHMIKLHHMVSDKIHARSTGPYTMVTQQPLGGKAQNGGQRFGEMEVWALEAYGAAATLQEMLTIKSDDVYGRAKAYESIIKDEPIVGPKLPESFNVLVKELQGLGLRVDLVDDEATVDAEHVIASSGPEDKTVAADNEEEEKYLDESDGIGEIDDGMSVQDIDEVEEIKEDA
ncbi:DNA-directed RNA polymerase subunit beta [Candidatus Nanosynbacter sp. TM7-076]|uniref:DNA-directed RNA polymerase subunit beta n=1 Tax=Candidatus Nanosynbacter sp. TM7-076 TaxID=2902629 RepID=UPI001FB5E869|nr:DNA-directed RNA polymerase subunit beta [Candidatus Nanosynbacter sp. TM7-076]MCJ1967991.1 DNA-directed RNA polymerase subunit beta [Candidatus Nanosynbacter sp. TM7-076]